MEKENGRAWNYGGVNYSLPKEYQTDDKEVRSLKATITPYFKWWQWGLLTGLAISLTLFGIVWFVDWFKS